MKRLFASAQSLKKLGLLGSIVFLLASCDGAKSNGEPAKDEAAQTASELEAAADDADDPKQAEVLQNQAEALNEVAEGDEEDVEGEVVVTGQ